VKPTGELVRLGYVFTPVPAWLRGEVTDGELSRDDFFLIAYLYEQADFKKLGQGLPTPTCYLKTIAKAISWRGELESLRRRLGRLSDLGRYFTYEVEGNSRTVQRYVFQLLTERPETLSDRRPPVPEPPRPPVRTSEKARVSRFQPASGLAPSARSKRPKAPTCPPVPSDCPPVQGGSKAHEQTLSALDREVSCPPASDVQSNQHLARTEWMGSKNALRDVARAREAEELEEARRRTRDFAEALPAGERQIVLDLMELLDAVLADDPAGASTSRETVLTSPPGPRARRSA